MKIPYISDKWRILFKPEKYGNYVNDHTIVKGADGDWHLYGITSFDGAMPITKLSAHAPEIIEENGKYYITTCGWTDKPVPHKGCVSITSLEWK